MLYFISGSSERQWHVGSPFPRNLNPSDVSEVQADGDELYYVKQLRPDYPPQKGTDRVQSWYGASAFAIASAIKEDSKPKKFRAHYYKDQEGVYSYFDSEEEANQYMKRQGGHFTIEKVPEESKQPCIVFTGETVRVSVARETLNCGGDEKSEGYAVVIEKAAGMNVFGNKQWTVVKNPHPQLLELAKELAKK